MSTTPDIVVSGIGLALPGIDRLEDLASSEAADRSDTADAVDPVDTVARLGRKGLRYLDRATQLALCAGFDALVSSGLLAGGTAAFPPGAPLTVASSSVAVIASSNLGNLDSVCDVAGLISDEGSTRLVSPISAPRLSSNVIGSEVAIRFGLRGPNVMLCNGDPSALDAIHWATVLLRAGRAQQVLVIGVEPDTSVARKLLGVPSAPVLDGAVAIVMERADAAASRPATVQAHITSTHRGGDATASVATLAELRPALWYVAGQHDCPGAFPGADRRDVTATWGPASGALGALQCAHALAAFAATDAECAVLTAAGVDAATTIVLRRAPARDEVPAA